MNDWSSFFMTQADLNSIYQALRDLHTRMTLLEASRDQIAVAIGQLNRRLQLQEAGTAMFEVSNGIGKECH